MSNIKSAKLSKILKHRSQSDKQFKYEIYQSSDGITVFAMVSWLIELLDGSGVWVWSVVDEEVILLTGGQQPDFADQAARDHFNAHYANE